MRKVYELSKLIHTQDKLFSGDGIDFLVLNLRITQTDKSKLNLTCHSFFKNKQM